MPAKIKPAQKELNAFIAHLKNDRTEDALKLLDSSLANRWASSHNNGLICFASNHNQLSVVKKLLNKREVRNTFQSRLPDMIIQAAQKGHFEVLQYLISLPEAKDVGNSSYRTAISKAASANQIHTFICLLGNEVSQHGLYVMDQWDLKVIQENSPENMMGHLMQFSFAKEKLGFDKTESQDDVMKKLYPDREGPSKVKIKACS